MAKKTKSAKSATGSITPLPEDGTKAVAADGGSGGAAAMMNVLSLIPATSNVTQGEKVSQLEADGEPKASKNPYVREIQKRLAKINKKKRQIEQLEAKIAHLSPEEQKTTSLINKDERAKMSVKVALDSQHSEYTDILNSFTTITTEDDKARSAEKSTSDANFATKIGEAKKEGKAEGIEEQRDVLHTVFKFLRLAGYRRAVPDGEAAENDAIEKVLVMVYSSEETATQAAQSMANGTDEIVEGSDNISYGRIKELATTLFINGEDQVAAEGVDGEPTQITASEESGVSVTDGQVPVEELTEAVPSQSLTTDLTNGDHNAPSASLIDDGAANEAAVKGSTENSQVSIAPSDTFESIPSGGESWENGAAATITPSWAEESTEAAQQVTPGEATTETGEDSFREVPFRHGSHRGRRGGDGPHRGGEGHRGRGGFRGDGFRGGRGGGGYRGRGEFRGGRGGGEFRGRGDRGSGGGHRGRGSWNEHRGDRPDNKGSPGNAGAGDVQAAAAATPLPPVTSAATES